MSFRQGSGWSRVRAFVGELIDKGGEDNLFFVASGLTFNLMLAALPFLLLLVSVTGLLLAPQVADPGSRVLERLWDLFPAAMSSLPGNFREQVLSAVESAGSVSLVSGVLFAWFSTRLFGSLRTVLGEVFDLRDERGIVEGKLMDLRMVLISTLLLSLNVGLSALVSGLGMRALELLGIRIGPLQAAIGWTGAFLFLFLMFLVIYKYLPPKNLPWRTAVSAAAVATVGFELLKAGFGWYLSNVANFERVFTAFATPVVVVVSLYYAAVLFVFAGEVAQLLQERRTMRRQRAILD